MRANDYLVKFFLMLAAPGFVMADKSDIAEWRLVPAQSRLEFVFGQAGTDERGAFNSFQARFYFDSAALEQSRFEVSVDMQSVNTGDKDRDEILRSADMFAVAKWPVAHFRTVNIKSVGRNEYLAEAELTIRDQTRPVPFPFHLVISSVESRPVFHLKTEISINRLNYGVGQGEWADTTWIADPVTVFVDVQAVRE